MIPSFEHARDVKNGTLFMDLNFSTPLFHPHKWFGVILQLGLTDKLGQLLSTLDRALFDVEHSDDIRLAEEVHMGEEFAGDEQFNGGHILSVLCRTHCVLRARIYCHITPLWHLGSIFGNIH